MSTSTSTTTISTSTTTTSTSISTTTSTSISTSTTTTLSAPIQAEVDVRATVNRSSDVVELEVVYKDRSSHMTARRDWTLEQLAYQLLYQEFPPDPDKVFQKQLTIDAHKVGVAPADWEWVVDGVSAAQLPDEAAQEGFESLPGWATWDADEAAQWIEDNVIDLASAKVALKAMARAIVYLRDWRR